jgi:hypothetical protein
VAYDPVKRRENYLKYRDREMSKSRERSKKRTRHQNYMYRIKSKYGMASEDYDYLLVRQDYRCAICHEDGHNLYVDHSHETGLVRGLLCHQCNIGLGNFKDDPKRLGEALRYLDSN